MEEKLSNSNACTPISAEKGTTPNNAYDDIRNIFQSVTLKSTSEKIEDKMIGRGETGKKQNSIEKLMKGIEELKVTNQKENRNNEFIKRRRIKSLGKELAYLEENLSIDKAIYNQLNDKTENIPQLDLGKEYLGNITNYNSNEELYIGLSNLSWLLANETFSKSLLYSLLGISEDIIKLILTFLEKDKIEIIYEALSCLTGLIVPDATTTTLSFNYLFLDVKVVKKLLEMIKMFKILEIKEKAMLCLLKITEIGDISPNLTNLIYEEINHFIEEIEPEYHEKCIDSNNSSNAIRLLARLSKIDNNCGHFESKNIKELTTKVCKLLDDKEEESKEDIEFRMALYVLLQGLVENFYPCFEIAMSHNILGKLAYLLKKPKKEFEIIYLKIIGSIVKASVKASDDILGSSLIFKIKDDLFNLNDEIRQECCWIIRNLSSPKSNPILIKLNFFDLLKHVFETDSVQSVSQNAALALCNLSLTDDTNLYKLLIEKGLINILGRTIEMKRIKNITSSLDALLQALTYCDRVNPEDKDYTLITQNAPNIMNTLQSFQTHGHDEVFCKALNIITKYFPYLCQFN